MRGVEPVPDRAVTVFMNSHSRPAGKMSLPPDACRNSPSRGESIQARLDKIADVFKSHRVGKGHPAQEPRPVPLLKLEEGFRVCGLKKVECDILTGPKDEHNVLSAA